MSYSDQRHGPTPIEALESAIAIPDAFTVDEMQRTLRSNHYDVMKSALQLRKKHEWRKEQRLDHLNVANVVNELKKEYVYFLDEAIDNQRCPMILIRACKFRPNVASAQATATSQCGGAVDGSTSFQEALKTFVYLIELAIECMEDEKAPGIVYLIDLQHTTTNNFDAFIIPSLLTIVKDKYPETVKKIYLLNTSTFSRTAGHAFMAMMSESSKKKIAILPEDHRAAFDVLKDDIPIKHIPRVFGGQYAIPEVESWIEEQAELEDVELDEDDDDALAGGIANIDNIKVNDKEKELISKEASTLNGMQYAGCSVRDVIEMKLTAIRGTIWRKKGDASSGVSSALNVFGFGWSKAYAVLRPDAVLLYADIEQQRPEIIIPLVGALIKAEQFPNQPRSSSGFSIAVPMSTHMLATLTEQDRGRWLQEIQMAIDGLAEKTEREEFEIEEKIRADEAFEKFNMISFDSPPKQPKPSPNPPVPPANLMQQQQINYPPQGWPMQQQQATGHNYYNMQQYGYPTNTQQQPSNKRQY